MKWPWSKTKAIVPIADDPPQAPAQWFTKTGEVIPNCPKTAGDFWCGMYEGHSGPHGHPLVGMPGVVVAPWGNNSPESEPAS